MWGSIFNCKWPAKVLQDLFTLRFLPDAEFKPFERFAPSIHRVQTLRPTRPACLRPKVRIPFPTRKITIAEAAARSDRSRRFKPSISRETFGEWSLDHTL